MNDERYKRYLSDVTSADVANDEAVVAARQRLAEIQGRHSEAAVAVGPLADATSAIQPQIDAARVTIAQLEAERRRLAAEVVLGITAESEWRENREALDQQRDLIERLTLAGPVLAERRNRLLSRVSGIAGQVATADLDVEMAIRSARDVLARERMNA